MDPYGSTTHILAHHDSEQTLSVNELEMQPLNASSTTLASSKPDHTVIKVNADDTETRKPKRLWASGVRLAAYANAFVLLVNVVLTIAGASYGDKYSRVLISMYEGNCKHTKRIATGLHILINILSTVLVATSSYCCQLLMAPTREDVDHAHSHRIWLPIGTFDVKRLSLLPRGRKLNWYLMFCTSIAIQLIFNSAVYASTSANDYSAIMVPSSFALNDSLTPSDFGAPPDSFESIVGYNLSGIHADIRNKTKFESLNVEQFTKDYGIGTLSNRRTVVCLSDQLDTGAGNTAESIYWAGSGFPLATSKTTDGSAYAWMEDGIDPRYYAVANFSAVSGSSVFPLVAKKWPAENATAEDWPISGVIEHQRNFTVKNCLSEKTEESCKLFVNIPICVIVIVCNVIKLICMFFAALEDRDEVLITIGDAIASFLKRPDPTTANDCMAPMSTMRLWGPQDYVWKSLRLNRIWQPPRHLPPPLRPEKPPNRRRRWINASNVCICAMGYMITIIAITVLALLIFHNDSTVSQGIHVGMGEINSATLLTGLNNSFTPNILLVNTIQLVVTSLYFLYNDMLTRMLLAAEYNSYALERKPLRVSFPKGNQRSTFYLTIPYRYSAPLLITFTIVHWLVSEGFYFVQVLPHSIWNREVPNRLLNTCGYSPKALLGAVGIMVLMAVMIFGLSYRRFKAPRMPLAMNCSATISAACHRPVRDAEAAFKPVMWGEVDMKGLDAFGEDTSLLSFLHCSFTSEPVMSPNLDALYV